MRDKTYIIRDLVLNHKEWDSAMNLLAQCPSRSFENIHKGMNAYSYEEKSIIQRIYHVNHNYNRLREEIHEA